MNKEFELLKTEGILGFYNSCEVTTIFIFNKQLKETFNFYTLISFEEKKHFSIDEKFLSDKQFNISNELSLGIIQYNLTFNDAIKAYHNLLNNNYWGHKGKKLHTNNLIRLNKQFIKSNGSGNVPINSILKNNFHNGSYIIEFFDSQKSFPLNILSNNMLGKICNFIKNVIPIDLEFISDRIGNIIFQFPSNLIELDYTSTEDWDGLNIKLVWDDRIINKNHYFIQVSDEFDEVITSFGITDKLVESEYKVITGNSNFLNNIYVIDSKNNLILSSKSISFMKEFNLQMDFSTQYSENRSIKRSSSTDTNETIKQIEIVGQSNNRVKKDLDYIDWINRRKYKNEKEALSRRLEFVQYGKNGNERIKALNDIRTLINEHGREGVYLWDPYLTYQDIIETLYYCKYSGVEMKAITSYDKKRRKVYRNDSSEQELNILDWFDIQRNGFKSSSNNLGINLEFRCQNTKFGWKFHDRFLIFPSSVTNPKVWSLGISVNGLGKEHHILQLVSNPQNIIDAFNELWENLDDEDCIIWRS